MSQAGYSPAAILSELSYLGLDNVRQHAIGPQTPGWQVGEFNQLAHAGVKFDWLTGGGLGDTLAGLEGFLASNPGAISTVEGPNEVNNFPIKYDDLTGLKAALAYQQALFSDLDNDRWGASLPVLSFTDNVLPVGAAADALNVHLYPAGGVEPMAKLAQVEANVAAQAPGKPLYVTEAGYASLPSQGVNAATQAKLTLNLIMDAQKDGVGALYLYDLSDDGADPRGADAIDHYGLFSFGGGAKPVAVAIHNLTTLLADTGAAARTFTPTPLNYQVTGLPADGGSLVFEKSSGVYDIVLWAEPEIWNATTHTPIAASGQTVTISFGGSKGQVAVYDPLVSASAISSQASAAGVSVSVVDHPIIIQVAGLTQAMAAFASPGAAAINPTTLTSATHPPLIATAHQ